MDPGEPAAASQAAAVEEVVAPQPDLVARSGRKEAKLLSSIKLEEEAVYSARRSAGTEPDVTDATPALEQVYAENESMQYWSLDCKSRPDRAFRIEKTVALQQGYSAAICLN